MTISLVIPTFNSESYIEETLRHVIDEMPQHVTEVIVVNDSSDDQTKRVLQKVLGAPYLRVVDTPKNQGQAIATITGIYLAREQFVAVLDDDLQYPVSNLTKLVDCMERNRGSNIVFGYSQDKQHSSNYNIFVELAYLFLPIAIPWIGKERPVTSNYLVDKGTFSNNQFHPIYAWEWRGQYVRHVKVEHVRGVRLSSTYTFITYLRQFKSLIAYFVSTTLLMAAPLILLILCMVGRCMIGLSASLTCLMLTLLLRAWLTHHKGSIYTSIENEYQKI